jgi:hypothetical protein
MQRCQIDSGGFTQQNYAESLAGVDDFLTDTKFEQTSWLSRASKSTLNESAKKLASTLIAGLPPKKSLVWLYRRKIL